MTIRLPLEDFFVDFVEAGPILPIFGAEIPAPEVDIATEAEQTISQAYDLGYQTGWAARDLELAASQSAVIADLHEAVHALTFTLEEARHHMVLAVEPVFRTLIAQVLPDLAAKTWGQHVLEELMRTVQQAAEAPVTLALAPQASERMREQISEAILPSFRLIFDPNLTALQAGFRFGSFETLLDFDELLSRINRQVEAALAEAPKEFAHG